MWIQPILPDPELAMRDGATTPPPVLYHDLPLEILQQIFLRAIPPDFLLDSSLSAGPDSPWCRAIASKKSVILVCKEWYNAGIWLLYEHIVFRRVDQIPALLRTLETSAENFSEFINAVTLHAYIPEPYADSFVTYMERLIDLCPHLSRFNFTCRCALPFTARFPVLSRSITHLQVDARVLSPAELFSILDNVCNNLSWLSMCIPETSASQYLPEQCHLPNLETLLIVARPIGNGFLSSIGKILSVPRLRRLTVKLEYYVYRPALQTIDMDDFTSFCEMHGRQLQFPHVQPTFIQGMNGFKLLLQRMVDACPVLEHLVLHPRADPVTHPNVKWIDIWSPHALDSGDSWKSLRQSITRTAFPELQGVRELSSSLMFFSSDIPTVFPPYIISAPKDALEFRFLGVYVRYDPGFLWSERQIDVDRSFGEDNSDDEDFFCETSSSSSSSFYDDSSTTSSQASLGEMCAYSLPETN
ncbi:hypothetical protein LshimejAT787_1901440 [Lyophyllum shimeji]|uniref:F-box domain-containing protein n=1 Tax=Lyophyllum shimeji TaxID=47721 RepID=A0A9P3Q0K5_LYOSH|nr:hypothetical protein LshimejAT787_1901440 [Lyophyllum shimeji]